MKIKDMGILDKILGKVGAEARTDIYDKAVEEGKKPGKEYCDFEVRTNKERTAFVKDELESHMKENGIEGKVATGGFHPDSINRYDDRITVTLPEGQIVAPELRDELQGVIDKSAKSYDKQKAQDDVDRMKAGDDTVGNSKTGKAPPASARVPQEKAQSEGRGR